MGNAFSVALVGMVVVFVALILIILCIRIFSKAVVNAQSRRDSSQKNESPIAVQSASVEAVSTVTDNTELIAVITAAVVASMQSTGTTSGIQVKSIKRIGHTTPIWNVAGRNEYILSKL